MNSETNDDDDDDYDDDYDEHDSDCTTDFDDIVGSIKIFMSNPCT